MLGMEFHTRKMVLPEDTTTAIPLVGMWEVVLVTFTMQMPSSISFETIYKKFNIL